MKKLLFIYLLLSFGCKTSKKENIEDRSFYRVEAPTNDPKYLRVENVENEVTPIQDSVIIDPGCCSVFETIIFHDPPIKTHYNGKYLVLDRGENEIYWEKNGKEISENEVWAGTSIGTYYPKKASEFIIDTLKCNRGYAGRSLSDTSFWISSNDVGAGSSLRPNRHAVSLDTLRYWVTQKDIILTNWGINN